MRKKHFFLFLQIMVMISLIASFIGNNTNAADPRSDMDQLARGISKKSGTVIEWSLHTRETIDLSSKDQFIHKVRSQFPEWVWAVSSSKDLDNVTGRMEHDDFRETIKVVTMKKDGSPSYISYEIVGKVWNARISRKTEEILQSRMNQLFKSDVPVFSCIKGVFSEDKGNVAKDLLRFFQAEEKEALKEKDFYSISAYSSHFSQSISLTEQEMNLQIGLRKNETGSTSFVIGTPILTNEY